MAIELSFDTKQMFTHMATVRSYIFSHVIGHSYNNDTFMEILLLGRD